MRGVYLFFSQLALVSFSLATPLVLAGRGYNPVEIGVQYLFFAATNVSTRFLFGFFSDKVGSKTTAAISLLLLALSSLVFFLFPGWEWVSMLLFGVAGSGFWSGVRTFFYVGSSQGVERRFLGEVFLSRLLGGFSIGFLWDNFGYNSLLFPLAAAFFSLPFLLFIKEPQHHTPSLRRDFLHAVFKYPWITFGITVLTLSSISIRRYLLPLSSEDKSISFSLFYLLSLLSVLLPEIFSLTLSFLSFFILILNPQWALLGGFPSGLSSFNMETVFRKISERKAKESLIASIVTISKLITNALMPFLGFLYFLSPSYLVVFSLLSFLLGVMVLRHYRF